MRFPTYLVRRGGVFYYRAKVPVDLIDQVKRREVWLSLRTSDRKSAELRLADTHAQQLRIYEVLRQGVSSAPLTDRDPLLRGFKPAKKAHEQTIEGLLDYWASQTERRPRTLLDANTAVRRLKEIVGSLPCSQLDKRHAVQLKDSLIAEGLAHATASKNLGLIKSIFETAHANDLIALNPFKAVKLVKPARQDKPRVSFTKDELHLIFHSKIYVQGHRPRGGAGEAAVWLPRIAYMTGMRLEEIGLLTRDDIKFQDGICFINLDHEPERGRWLKNSASRRQIPIHPRLIDLGLMDLVEKANGRLFPELSSSGVRQQTASWSQWFGRYLRQVVGITDRRKTFHSFRHTFKDVCREAGVSKDVHDRLTGHASQDVGDQYGGSYYPLKPLNEAISKLEFII
jgi:integrase